MKSPPRIAERKRASASETAPAVEPKSVDAPKIAFAKRLPAMSDYQLSAYQASANRISRDPEHPKNATAIRSIPLVEAEISRRANGLGAVTAKDADK
jgi:hypothetical protein